MQHRIVVLGAGYAGATAAGFLARSLPTDDVEVTVVNAEPDFVERLRLHQLVAGQDLQRISLSDVFDGTGIRLRVARVTDVDPVARTVRTTSASGGNDADTLTYDTLLYTLGSTVETSVQGVREYAFDVATRPSAQRLRDRLDDLTERDQGGRVLVVGGNLTAIEVATEIAEARPGLDVALVTTDELGGWLGTKARSHLLRAFERFGIAVHEDATVARVDPEGVVVADGRTFGSDVTVWAAGFAVDPIAAASGLAVEEDGRIVVDEMMRSVSHPRVYAAGDSAYAVGGNGQPLPMSCASAGFTRMRATAAIIHDLTGRTSPRTPLTYVGNCISLGQQDGIFQVADGNGEARSWALTGGMAARVKASVLKGTAWNISHPTFGLPVRRRPLASDSPAPEKVAA